MAGGWNLSWVTPELAVGGRLPQGSAHRLAAELRVGAVIDVRSEACDDADEMAAAGIWFLHLPTDDHAGMTQAMLDSGVRFARRAAKAGRRLLIHCEHGIGRSATVALCVLVDAGIDPLAALERAKSARTLVSPSPAQYEAWAAWMRANAAEARIPSFEAFRAISYRHLGQRA